MGVQYGRGSRACQRVNNHARSYQEEHRTAHRGCWSAHCYSLLSGSLGYRSELLPSPQKVAAGDVVAYKLYSPNVVEQVFSEIRGCQVGLASSASPGGGPSSLTPYPCTAEVTFSMSMDPSGGRVRPCAGSPAAR